MDTSINTNQSQSFSNNDIPPETIGTVAEAKPLTLFTPAEDNSSSASSSTTGISYNA